MKENIWSKRLPTLLGLFLIAVGVAATSFLAQKGVIFTGRAGPTDTPSNIRITNISQASFTVSFATPVNVIGVINYGTNENLGQSQGDDKDSGSINSHKTHYITIENLNPSTKYFFSITSGQNKYLNNGSLYEVITAPEITSNPFSQNIIKGTVLMPDGNRPEEGVVYLNSGNNQEISSLIRKDGSYSISLANIRTKDLSSFANFFPDTNLNIFVVGPDQLSSQVSTALSFANPVPVITLSQNYDFSNNESVIPQIEDGQKLPLVNFLESNQKKEIKIEFPVKDQGLADAQPVFRGKALPNETVEITIHSQNLTKTTVKADSNGNWEYRPPSPLLAGQHTITIAAKDASGVLKTITQTFSIFVSGVQIAESATPSAAPTLIITPQPNLSPGPSATPEPTFAPTSAPLPTGIISPVPTVTRPGNSSVMGIGVLGIIVTIAGGFLFLVSRGAL